MIMSRASDNMMHVLSLQNPGTVGDEVGSELSSSDGAADIDGFDDGETETDGLELTDGTMLGIVDKDGVELSDGAELGTTDGVGILDDFFRPPPFPFPFPLVSVSVSERMLLRLPKRFS